MKKKSTTKKKRAAAPVQTKPVAPKTAAHYTAQYLLNPPHPITVNVIGCGGTGSQVLNSLARMNSALRALGHTGLFVRAIDPDKVSVANMGRQLFSASDVGAHKCTVLIGRINRYFGTDWQATPSYYREGCKMPAANITISCVDSGAARLGIKNALAEYFGADGKLRYSNRPEPFENPYYWIDFGNTRDRGQVVIGTLQPIAQPTGGEHRTIETLPPVHVLHPDILKDNKKDDQGPSCSLAEALGKQDLFINSNLANMGLAILWKMFREAHIKYHGCYLNLATMSTNPIKIQ